MFQRPRAGVVTGRMGVVTGRMGVVTGRMGVVTARMGVTRAAGPTVQEDDQVLELDE